MCLGRRGASKVVFESRVGAKSEEYDGEQGRDGERMSRDGEMSLSRR